MRIGIVLAVTPGYSETFFTSKIKGLQAQGHEVVLFVGKKEKEFDLCPVKKAPRVYRAAVLQLPMMFLQFMTLIPYLGRVSKFVKFEKKENTLTATILKKLYLNSHILKQRLDWLHFGFATQALEKELAAKAVGAKMGVSFRGFDLNVYPIKNPDCYQKLWKHVDKVHSISNYLLQKAYGMGLSRETPSIIITPAVVMQELPKMNELNVQETLKIVTIARLTWIKGVDIAIEAMRILHGKGIDFEYHIIGDGASKELERYQFMVYEFGLQDCVFFCGKLTHQAALEKLLQADIYVQSSLNEGFCNAVLEAQAMGKLVIASDAGGLTENIIHEETGWLFEVGNPNELANLINSIIALPKNDKELISSKAKERVRSNFGIKAQQEKFLEFYKD